MKHKIFTLFFALIVCAGTMFAEIIRCVQIGKLYYNLYPDYDQTAVVTYMENAKYSGDISIPKTVKYNSKTYDVTAIGYRAFSECSGLTSVTIPNSIIVIGEQAFESCTGLTSVTIPNSVTRIDPCAFSNCIGLTNINIPNSVTSIGGIAFGWCSNLTSVNIGNGVKSIGHHAFKFCKSLKSITIPNSVTTIEYAAFFYCVSLTSVTIPSSVTCIDREVFGSCKGLKRLIVENGNATYDSRNNCNAIIETSSNTLIASCKTTIIPNSVTSIGNYAFCCCAGLTSVVIPNSVISIGGTAFHECTDLTSVTISNSVKSIGTDAFRGCYNLTSISCEAVTPPTCGNSVFYSVKKTIPLYVPANSIEAYKEADQWKDFGDNILPIQAVETDVDITKIVTEPTDNSVTLEWPAEDDAAVYTIQILKEEELICTFSFNGDGQLLTLSYEKKASGNTPRTAIQTRKGWQYTIGGLEPETKYSYKVTVLDASDNVISNYKGTFSTKKTLSTYTIKVDCNDDDMGKVTGGGEYEEGEEITIKAIPYDGYHFVRWSDGNKQKTRKIIVTADATFTAKFAEDEDEAIDAIVTSQTSDCKFFKDGVLYILRDGKTYTVTGTEVE